jgi:hypothetical protein
MRVVELAAERDDLHAFVVIDHDYFAAPWMIVGEWGAGLAA